MFIGTIFYTIFIYFAIINSYPIFVYRQYRQYRPKEGKAAADAKFERVFKSTKIKRSALDKVVQSNKGKGKA